MPFPWQTFMEGRTQDREIRKFLNQAVVAAYGGMVNETLSPTTINLTTTPQKLTVFDQSIPRNYPPLLVSFDQANSELDFSAGSSGVYSIALEINAQVQQNRTYIFELRDNDTSIGVDFQVTLAGNADSIETTINSYVHIQEGHALSVWVSSNLAATFTPYTIGLVVNRVSSEVQAL